MHDTDRHSLRTAAEAVEDAHSRVTELANQEHQVFAMTDPDYVTPRELHALRQIDADLRSACTRLWSLVEKSRSEDQ